MNLKTQNRAYYAPPNLPTKRADSIPSLISAYNEDGEDSSIPDESFVTSSDQAPYMVSIGIIDSDRHVCGGAIISNRFILTAASCVQNPNRVSYDVLYGTINTSDGGFEQVVELVIKHPDFNDQTKVNNIALLKTREEIEFDETVKPARLGAKINSGGFQTVTHGWGISNEVIFLI